MHIAHIISLIGLLGIACAAPEAPKVQQITSGLSHITVPFTSNGRPAQMHLLIVDQKHYCFRVLDNGADRKHPRYKNLEEAVRTEKCVAGANASYFNVRQFTPVGLMISNRIRSGQFIASGWPHGVVSVRNRKLTIEFRDDFHEDDSISDLIQSGPWLIRESAIQQNLPPDEPAVARTFIATDPEHHIALGYCDRAKLIDIPVVLTTPLLTRLYHATNVLDLDGGPSSGLVLIHPTAGFSIPTKWTVRNFLAIAPLEAKEQP